jgi:carbon-monoxide dehydrogenase medium subunit
VIEAKVFSSTSLKEQEMIGEFEYVRVSSVEQGCTLLAEHNGNAKILAGGTDLLVNVRNGKDSPTLLVDLKGIVKLAEFQPDGKEGALIGASVPLNVLVEDRVIRQNYRALAEAAASIGTYQIRNRATLAGNLCNASPAADTAPALFVLDAVATV